MNYERNTPAVITHLRLDERLLHGIIATQWIPIITCDRVMIIDDRVALDPIKKELMKLMRPANKALSIITCEDAINHLKAHKYDGQNLFILTRTIELIGMLEEAGFVLPAVTMGMYNSREPQVTLEKRILLSRQEFLQLKNYAEKGVIFEVQYVPSEQKKDVTEQILRAGESW